MPSSKLLQFQRTEERGVLRSRVVHGEAGYLAGQKPLCGNRIIGGEQSCRSQHVVVIVGRWMEAAVSTPVITNSCNGTPREYTCRVLLSGVVDRYLQ
jgi:hypothetical protein